MIKLKNRFGVLSTALMASMIVSTSQAVNAAGQKEAIKTSVDALGAIQTDRFSADRRPGGGRPGGGRPGGGTPPDSGTPPVDEPPVDEPPVDEPPVDEPPVDEPPVDVVLTASDYFGHNQEKVGVVGRQDWGGSGDVNKIKDQVAAGNGMVVDFLPEKAGCGYVNCVVGEEILQTYLQDMATVGHSSIHEEALEDALDSLSDITDGVWLQMGNEVYSGSRQDNWEQYFGALTDEQFIAHYVEYWWAPFVAQVMKYESDNGVDFKLMLGSVGNAGGDNNRQMLLDTWNYVIQGWTAPELAGVRLGDLLDCASGHYLLSSDNDYLPDMTEILSQTGCYWATEEIGRRRSDSGIGYDEMNKVIGRSLQLVAEQGLAPDQFRVLPWETTDDAARAIEDFEAAVGGVDIIGVTSSDGEAFQVYLSDGKIIDL